MTARPQRVLTHQQSDAQLHVQLKGLWILSRSVRPMGRMLVRREEGLDIGASSAARRPRHCFAEPP
jgi:hypothetical protein